MIYPNNSVLNNDLAVLVRTLHRETRKADEKTNEKADEIAIRQILENMEYLLQSAAARLSSYNALEIATEIDMPQKKLPAVNRSTYRPQTYLRAVGIFPREEKFPFSFVVPFPLNEEAKQYSVQLRLYATETQRVSGLTINMGRDNPINLFFYAQEITHLRIGDAVHQEYARLLVSKQNYI